MSVSKRISLDNPEVQKMVKRMVDECNMINVSGIVEYILSKNDPEAPFSYDDIKNRFVDNTDLIEETKRKYHILDERLSRMVESDQNKDEIKRLEWEFGNISEELSRLEETHNEDKLPEVLEWWMVDSWIANRLEEEGEVIISTGQEYFWGRDCHGQPIYMDQIMLIIARTYDFYLREYAALNQFEHQLAQRKYEHAKGLAGIFKMETTVTDYIEYYEKLCEVEEYAHHKVEQYNNGVITAKELEAYEPLILGALKPLINKMVDLIEINWDARGYAVKLTNDASEKYQNVRAVFRDIGSQIIVGPQYETVEE